MSRSPIELRVKAKQLAALACDEGATEPERMNAALRLAKLVVKHDLLSSPFDSVFSGAIGETAEAAATIFDRLTDPELLGSVKKVARKLRRRR